MTNSVIPFDFNFHPVRVIMRDDDPWFVAADICDALGYKNSRKAVADHLDDDERCNQSLHRGGSLTLISESGLYALVLRSRKPEARKFAKWVTSEVLPSIRKIGSYSSQPELPMDAAFGALRRSRWLLSFDSDGKPSMQPVADSTVMIDPGSATDVALLIKQRVPFANVMPAVMYGLARINERANGLLVVPKLSSDVDSLVDVIERGIAESGRR